MTKHKTIQKVKKSRKIGLSPGHLIFLGDTKAENVTIQLIEYDSEEATSVVVKDIAQLATCKSSPNISWIDINGLHDTDIIDQVGKMFDIHALTLEDILNTDQRPKVDFHDHYIYIVVKMIYFDEKDNRIEYEQVSLILGDMFVISLQERESDVFEPLRERLMKAKGRVRTLGADYLSYALLDVIIDNYFLVMEKFGERIEFFEEQLIISIKSQWLNEVYSLKRELLFLRRSVWPMREVITKLERAEHQLIKEKTNIFLRDIYDHTIQVIESIEIYRDMISGLLDLYLSSVSNKMNQVMKVLTIISTIFIPLTFIVGVYGMNFDNMPELRWHYGYYIVMSFMLLLAIGMFIAFKKRDWL